MPRAAQRLFVAFCLALLAWLPARAARADDPGDGLPIVASGREAEIQALVAPLAMGKEIGPGWSLSDITIGATAIRFVARGPGGATATLRLENPERAPSPERTGSFSLHRETSAGSAGGLPPQSVLDPLAAAVRTNDTGHFWPAPRPIAPGPHNVAPRSSRQAETPPARWEPTLRRKLLLAGLGAALLYLVIDRLRARRPAA
ncbi:MAG: hypothetical protein ABJE95_29840 [Byssovorax sp.]